MSNDIKKDGKSKEIIEDILNQIENTKIKIGEKLPSERDLSKKYNVSRIVIREVISYLKAINVVESVQGSGNYVKRYYKNSFGLSFPDYDVDDLMESRKILERSIAFSVFKHLDDTLINDMAKICDDFSKAIITKDLENSLVQDFKFHQLYAKYSKNPIIENFLDYLTSFIQQKVWRVMKEDYLFTNTYNKKTLENHQNILKALKERDLNKLLLYIELHYDTIIEGLKK
ncbi:MAG: GntR family transcriptional regulator [Thermotogota bacterium]|nr:GntR family transcriptional regulator [Thermotogota bacterium]